MDKITAKFVHGDAEFIREIEVDSADNPPDTYSLSLPGEHATVQESEVEPPWEAVYVREPNPERQPQWIYRYRGVVNFDEPL
ncbi:hypothetical protein [Catellatospora sichuanensis]|uniref:hypothetical protein n=1 Tax=Catellatospora sichuanensis TaxID=1969805 RepID=UPI0011822C69|nr:hypothetical protein [Catellatospora sichuanensis]